MAHSLKNKLLIETKDKVESNLPEELVEPVEQIVLAGMKLLYSPTTHKQLIQPVYDAAKASGFQPEQIANGMVNLIGAISKASNGKMAIEAAFPAGVILLCYVLDDLESTKGLSVTPALIKAVGSAMVKSFAKSLEGKGGPPEAQPGEAPPMPQEQAVPTPGGMAQQGVPV